MKNALLLTAASTLILSACAGVQTSQSGSSGTSVAASSGSMYCWKRSLSESGDTFNCNWAGSKHDACLVNGISANPLSKSQVAAGPKDAGRCENGEWLVVVNTK